MSRRTFRDDLRAAYEGELLPPQTRDRLMSMTDAIDTRRAGRASLTGWLVAALALVALGAFLLRGIVIGPAEPVSERVASIAEEIAVNHFKAKDVDFVGTDVAVLRTAMTELDFELADVSSLVGADARLVGGRYCSIGGVPAAQLKLEDGHGGLVTVYQALAVDVLDDLPQGQVPHDALRIELRRIGDVLVGLARAP